MNTLFFVTSFRFNPDIRMEFMHSENRTTWETSRSTFSINNKKCNEIWLLKVHKLHFLDKIICK